MTLRRLSFDVNYVDIQAYRQEARSLDSHHHGCGGAGGIGDGPCAVVPVRLHQVQHLTDWYTFSHVLHGIGFYFLLWLVARRLDPSWRFVLAVLLEATWEVAENSPIIINRYRAATIALDYFGDSIVNSMADIFAMILGFWIARKAPAWVSVAVFLGVEIALAAAIRDNLTLNIMMLIHPLEAVKRWQLGG